MGLPSKLYALVITQHLKRSSYPRFATTQLSASTTNHSLILQVTPSHFKRVQNESKASKHPLACSSGCMTCFSMRILAYVIHGDCLKMTLAHLTLLDSIEGEAVLVLNQVYCRNNRILMIARWGCLLPSALRWPETLFPSCRAVKAPRIQPEISPNPAAGLSFCSRDDPG